MFLTNLSVSVVILFELHVFAVASGFENLNLVRWIIDMDTTKKTNLNHVIKLYMSNVLFALEIIVTLRNKMFFM